MSHKPGQPCSRFPASSEVEDLEQVADRVLGEERQGPRTQLPEAWCPGDPCPRTGQPCERVDCWQAGSCPLYPAPTSDLAAEAGAILARWAEEAGAEGMCSGCAFRAGTRANRTDDTILQITGECMVSGEPFYCHDGLEHGETPRDVCRGWLALMPASPERGQEE